MFFVQLGILLACILIGARLKGMGLGIMGAAGTLIFIYGFQLPAGNPPIDVMLIILCVVTAAASLQVAGGMDYLVSIAERIIRSKPASITFIGPVVTFVLTFLAGTAHICYSVLPIIAEVSAKKGVRPERPLSISVIASDFAIIASPISAATAAMISELSTSSNSNYGLPHIMLVILPASLVGLIAGAVVANLMGPDIAPVSAADAPVETNRSGEAATFPLTAKLSVWVFIGGVASIMLLGVLFPRYRSFFDQVHMTMEKNIQLIMLAVVLINVLLAKIAATDIAKSSIFRSGTEAVVSIFGVVWMSNTFIQANEIFLTQALQQIVQEYVWIFAIALFIMAALMFSQASTVKSIMPLGFKLGIGAESLIAMYPACAGIFFIPSYPTLIAAINFDKTGTTRVGKYLLNHSFMLPGMVMMVVTILCAFLFSSLLL